jgi:hypothetical protein
VAYVALYTCPVLAHPADHPALQDFQALNRAMAEELRARPPAGLIRYIVEPDGPLPVPAHVPPGVGTHPTLSVWQDLASAFRYSYRAPTHRTALRRRREWFRWYPHPVYVLWYVTDPAAATWAEGVNRLNQLVREGPTPAAFDFLHPFQPDGTPLSREAARGEDDDDRLKRGEPVRVRLMDDGRP